MLHASCTFVVLTGSASWEMSSLLTVEGLWVLKNYYWVKACWCFWQCGVGLEVHLQETPRLKSVFS